MRNLLRHYKQKRWTKKEKIDQVQRKKKRKLPTGSETTIAPPYLDYIGTYPMGKVFKVF